ncbi:hypothetical protein [uncultured Tateyamaria sp.]|uniref:hypothetical protein n=1 Tax=Tateyamaria sp. 1078 TaxID=3417464 RepID=UPI0026064B04|nr:hypothetical protein [uncultured Tateyamaria sp.]
MALTDMTATAAGKTLHPDQIRMEDQVRRQTGRHYNALAAVMAAVPVAAILSIAGVIRFDLHWAWGVPLYGLCGAVVVGIIVSVVDYKHTH